MKNTNAQTVKNTKRKLAIVLTTLTTGLFALLGNSSIVQASDLVKAEPIKQINLYQEAKESLASSFTDLTISQDMNEEATINIMAKQHNSVNTNYPITLTKINLISE